MELKQPNIIIETHGCKLNQADSLQIATEFKSRGCKINDFTQPPAAYIVNSCTVTHTADKKARQALRKARKQYPESLVVATGCYAEHGKKILSKMPEVDIVLGNKNKKDIVTTLLDEYLITSDKKHEESIPQQLLFTRSRVKIQEGCNQICAYCIIPRVRGREISVPLEKILGQIQEYTDQGCKEVVLTGTQLGSYGYDFDDINLEMMLEQILDKTSIPRIRVSSLQPQEITDSLLSIWYDQRMCRHFHVPLQSGSNRILEIMRRRYTAEKFIETIQRIQEVIPDVGVTTDVIVGFPGETDEEFNQTLHLAKSANFAKIHVFPYSARPGTTSFYLKNDVDPRIIKERAKILNQLAREKQSDFLGKFVGTKQHVLWDQVGESTPLGIEHKGITDNYIRVLLWSKKNSYNQIIEADLFRKENGYILGSVTE